jgi:hypothetical protein
MSIGHRPDPNNFAGAEARRESYNERATRLSRLSAKPLPRFLLETALKIAVVLAAGGAAYWLLSRLRGY